MLDRSDLVSLKSVRNLDGVHVLAADQLNTYDVLCADDVVFTKAASRRSSGAQPGVGSAGDEADRQGGQAGEGRQGHEKAARREGRKADKAEPAEKPAKKAAATKAARGRAG